MIGAYIVLVAGTILVSGIFFVLDLEERRPRHPRHRRTDIWE